MAKVRSPNFPSLGLASALGMARKVFDKDNRNKVSRAAVAKHLGHESLSGPALSKLGAIRAYGLIEGTGDDIRISEDAITAMMAPEGSAERKSALARLALHPQLFKDLRSEFPDVLPSEENLRYRLIQRGFPGDAATRAGRTFLSTMSLVDGAPREYDLASEEAEDESMSDDVATTPTPETRRSNIQTSFAVDAQVEGTRREVITLDEGDVVITFPENLSAESFGDLKDHLDLFIKKMHRRATIAERN